MTRQTTANKRHVLITGSSRGIGAACATTLMSAGHTVIGVSRTRGALPDSARHVELDLSQPESISGRLAALSREDGVDALVCNAGAGAFGSIETLSAERIRSSIALNLVAPLLVVRECLPTLRRHPRSDIVFIGSESALAGGRYGSIYSAAKFGLRGAAQALRAECAAANCHVGIVQPGMTRTSFFDELDFEPGPESQHALDPADVARAVTSLIESSDDTVIEEIVVNPRQRVVRRRDRTGS